MAVFDDDLSACAALVIDGNPTSRSILVSQLRDFGVGSVAQAARTVDARRQLEFKAFDFVLCEHSFTSDEESGQALLDDLRRNHLLPFSTIFIMITAESKTENVVAAKQAGANNYIIKPFNAETLKHKIEAVFEA